MHMHFANKLLYTSSVRSTVRRKATMQLQESVQSKYIIVPYLHVFCVRVVKFGDHLLGVSTRTS